jgi:3-oxoacyl-[acyl-carrier protein] reductase
MILENRVALITGAGSGIGRVIAIAFAREGAQVVLTGRRLHKLEETAALCNAPSLSSKAIFEPADISEESEVTRLQERVLNAFGRCDILVNNAGIFKPEPGILLHQAGLDDWNSVMQTNVRGAFLCLRAFAPTMIEQRYGRVINVTSGLKHSAGHGVYSISKSALDALTKTAAHELEEHNILVNALNPGWVKTEMAQNAPDDPQKVAPLALKLASLPEGEPSGVEHHA